MKLNIMKFFALALAAAALACTVPLATPTPTAGITLPDVSVSVIPPPELVTLVPDAGASSEPLGVFELAVIVDTSSEPVSQAQAQAVVDDASAILQELTGFAFAMVDYVQMAPTGTVSGLGSDYIAGHTAADLPNGIIIFSYGDGGDARLFGGYSLTLPGPSGFTNEFVSPSLGGGSIYVAINHFSHRYAACGYGSSELDTPIQTTSFNGECRNQDGVACVDYNGYSMCSTSTGDLYASTLTYFAASTIVHEMLHPFGPSGVDDHYATPGCNTVMASGVSTRPYATSFDLAEAQYYNGQCPFVYDNFEMGYMP
jgi:hypothetical protein